MCVQMSEKDYLYFYYKHGGALLGVWDTMREKYFLWGKAGTEHVIAIKCDECMEVKAQRFMRI